MGESLPKAQLWQIPVLGRNAEGLCSELQLGSPRGFPVFWGWNGGSLSQVLCWAWISAAGWGLEGKL